MLRVQMVNKRARSGGNRRGSDPQNLSKIGHHALARRVGKLCLTTQDLKQQLDRRRRAPALPNTAGTPTRGRGDSSSMSADSNASGRNSELRKKTSEARTMSRSEAQESAERRDSASKASRPAFPTNTTSLERVEGDTSVFRSPAMSVSKRKATTPERREGAASRSRTKDALNSSEKEDLLGGRTGSGSRSSSRASSRSSSRATPMYQPSQESIVEVTVVHALPLSSLACLLRSPCRSASWAKCQRSRHFTWPLRPARASVLAA